MEERLLRWIGWLGQRLGLDDMRLFTSEDLVRLGVLVVVCLVTSLLVVDFARAPTDPLVEGDPAPRTVKAPFTFHYSDHVGHEAARKEASDRVQPVFVYRADLASDVQGRVEEAFERSRTALGALEQGLGAGEGAEGQPAPLPSDAIARLNEGFRDAIGVHVPDNIIGALIDDRFSEQTERATRDLLAQAMQLFILRDRENVPSDGRGVRMIALRSGEQTESVVRDLTVLKSPTEARQQVNWAALERKGSSEAMDAASVVAKALVRANVSYAPLQTEEARRDAEASVPLETKKVKRSAILFRAGDTLTPQHIQLYKELQSQREDSDILAELLALTLLLLLLLVSLYYFGATYLQAFTTNLRDVAAVGTLLFLTAFVARVVVASSEGIADLIGYDIEARSVWFGVPLAGAAMLVRSLLGVGWTWLFTVAAAVVCGLMMDLQVLPVVFFLISAMAGASAVEHARERISVLRAGLYVGMVNAVCVLIIHFVQLFVTEVELGPATAIRPLWSMSFAFLGGIVSAAAVLFFTPAFEWAGYVTDIRLMELANLNHPALRGLMLRAPGTYHHSVIVGTLAEAGCERIGANGLRAKVAAYFHDIGKSKKPPYFIENQRDGINRHDGLDPYTSARIIISHVTDGGRMAREHGLPQPVIDNIYMHHGTGLLNYFYRQAIEQADSPDDVDEGAFRYPGPRPNTREAGVLMLADKVEAATRTLHHPDEANIRAMISRIISSVIADGQFAECPLTLEEIHAVAETFVSVLLGIYHQRIEYPDTKDVSKGRGATDAVRPTEPPKEAFITLEITPSSAEETQHADADEAPDAVADGDAQDPQTPETVAEADEESSDVIDYESLEHLPGGPNHQP